MTPRKQLLVAVVTGTILVVAALLLTPTPNLHIHFQSCEQAREAGAPMPLHAGDPGWSKALDPDNDGVEC